MEPSKDEYQPIEDKETTKLVDDTSSTSTESTAKPATPKRTAPSYDQATSLPNAEPVGAQSYSNPTYQSYQNAPPPAYQNLPEYSVPSSNTNYPIPVKRWQDVGFTIFFLAWFIPANVIFARIVAEVDFGAWWGNTTVPYWGFISAAVLAVIFSQIWIFLSFGPIFTLSLRERRATIGIFTFSAIALSFVGRFGTIYSWVYLIWIACIVRILWDACVTSADDNYFSASIIQLVKPQIKSALVPIVILQVLTFFWLLFWGFNYSLLAGTEYGYPAAHAFLFLVMIWSMMVMRAVVMSTVSAIIAHWYNNSGAVNVNTYATTALMENLIHCFGSVIFASIFVDAFGVITWLLTRFHALLYGKKVKKSVLTKISSKIEKVVNSSSYTIIVPEKQDFVEASQKAHAYLKGASPAMRSTTMKYHNLFFALQAFTFSLGGSANPIAATACGMYVFAFTSIFHAACVALTTSYGRNPSYLQSIDNALAAQFQQKLAPVEKQEV